MEILDWRPWQEKCLTRLWRPSQTGILPPVGRAGRIWAGWHQRLLERRIVGRRLPDIDAMVISVGNLALGGTGKTPVVMAVAQALARSGRRGVVVTRGFRSKLSGPLIVRSENSEAGDEARLLAGELADTSWTVVQAQNRAGGIAFIGEALPQPQVILLEDGHQTAAVGRDLDVVILDHWEVGTARDQPRVIPRTGHVFPLGPWREAAGGAERAAIWLLETAVELPEQGMWGNTVLTFTRRLACRPANAAAITMGRAHRPALVSGIARPHLFEAGAQAELRTPVSLCVRLADHEDIGAELVARLGTELVRLDCQCVVTTAKDWVKMQAWWPAAIPAFVMDLQIIWGAGKTLPELIEERLTARLA